MADSTINVKMNLEADQANKSISELDVKLGQIKKIVQTMDLSAFRKSIDDTKNQYNSFTNQLKENYHALMVSQRIDDKETYKAKEKQFKDLLKSQQQSYAQVKASLEIEKARELAIRRQSFARQLASEREREQRAKLEKLRTSGFTFSEGMRTIRTLPNALMSSAISRGERAIDFNKEQISGIDKWFEENQALKGGEEWKAKEKEKQAIQSQNKELASRNAKIAAAQMAMNTAINTVKKLGQTANAVFRAMGIDIKNIFKDVFASIKQALSETGIASYNIGTSLFTNVTARETEFKYGLSGESAYALTQTMSMLNMKSDEDLMYMNERQKEAFNSIMERYKTWYSNLESTGAMEKMQEAQLEFKMFKEEISMKLLNWFAEHKDQIFNALEVTMNVLSVLAELVLNILNMLPGGKKYATSAANSSDTSSINNNSKINNVNISVNNTNNATANLNSQSELDNTLSNSNANLVKSIAANLSGL